MAVVVVPVLCVTSTGIGDSLSCSVSASPDSTLCFTLLAASRSCWACVQWQRVQCSRASQQPWATQHREVSVVCHLRRPYHPPHSTREVSVVCHLRRPCPPLHSTWPPVSGNRCRTSPLPLPPADRTSITPRRCEKRAQNFFSSSKPNCLPWYLFRWKSLANFWACHWWICLNNNQQCICQVLWAWSHSHHASLWKPWHHFAGHHEHHQHISYHWHCATWSEDSRRQTSVEKAITWQKSFEKLRPISNLPFLSKRLEKVVLHKLLSHLQEYNLSNPFRSA